MEELKSKSDIIKLLEKKFKFYELDGDVVDVKKLVKVSVENVEFEAEELPELLQYFGYKQARALRKFNQAETNYKVWLAKKDKILRIKKERRGIKFTENQISAEIRSSQDYMKYKEAIYDAEEQYEIIKSLYWTIQKRADIIEEIIKQKSVYSSKINKSKN